MSKQVKRNEFAFSRRGLTAIAGFTAAPSIADDRFRRAPDNPGSKPRPWLFFFEQAAQYECN